MRDVKRGCYQWTKVPHGGQETIGNRVLELQRRVSVGEWGVEIIEESELLLMTSSRL